MSARDVAATVLAWAGLALRSELVGALDTAGDIADARDDATASAYGWQQVAQNRRLETEALLVRLAEYRAYDEQAKRQPVDPARDAAVVATAERLGDELDQHDRQDLAGALRNLLIGHAVYERGQRFWRCSCSMDTVRPWNGLAWNRVRAEHLADELIVAGLVRTSASEQVSS